MKFLHNSFFLVFFRQLNFTGDFYALLNNAIVHPSALARELSLVKNEELFSQIIESFLSLHNTKMNDEEKLAELKEKAMKCKVISSDLLGFPPLQNKFIMSSRQEQNNRKDERVLG